MGNCLWGTAKVHDRIERETSGVISDARKKLNREVKVETGVMRGIDQEIRDISEAVRAGERVKNDETRREVQDLLRRRRAVSHKLDILTKRQQGYDTRDLQITSLRHAKDELHVDSVIHRNLQRLGMTPDLVEEQMQRSQNTREDVMEVVDVVDSFQEPHVAFDDLDDEVDDVLNGTSSIITSIGSGKPTDPPRQDVELASNGDHIRTDDFPVPPRRSLLDDMLLPAGNDHAPYSDDPHNDGGFDTREYPQFSSAADRSELEEMFG
jgi:hypothetical protein